VTVAARSVLVLSTTPPLPRDYGNRNRVHQTVSLFRRMGFAVSFLLYPMTETGPTAYRDIIDSWSTASTISPPSRTAKNCIKIHEGITTKSTTGGTTTLHST
jgi:hypothetical protein